MSNESNWTNLVVQQLDALTGGIDGLRTELQHVKNQLIELRAKEDRVQDLKSWKEKIDEIASPTQLRELTNEVESLKLFKTKAVTIFMVVQAIMAGALAVSKFIT